MQSLPETLCKKLLLKVGLMIVAEPEVLEREFAISKRTVVALYVRESTVYFCMLFLSTYCF